MKLTPEQFAAVLAFVFEFPSLEEAILALEKFVEFEEARKLN
jgi:hypothetical protein